MGLLDEVLRQLSGEPRGDGSQAGGQPFGNRQQAGSMLDLAMGIVQNYPGGLSGLVQQLTKVGFGSQASSWVGTGQNQPISPDDLTRALGRENLQSAGQRHGVHPDTASAGLASLLPFLIDQLTPKGQVEDNVDLAAALDQLRRR